MLKIICQDCHAEAEPLDWRCQQCGGILDWEELPTFIASLIEGHDTTLWRYREWLPIQQRLTLGEGMTPLVKTEMDGVPFRAKLEYLNPTGSYKDRGTAALLNHIAAYDVPEVIDDSSGNAGASVAAYASALGMRARIFVPAAGVAAKKALIETFGGTLVEVQGPQHAKTDACHEAAATTTYASHAWSPYFLLGQMTAGFEIWEQTGQNVPDVIVTPVGHGALFLGIARAFKALQDAGLIDQLPTMVAVQSEAIDPVVQGYEQGADEPPTINESQRTVADGIMVNRPVRGVEILATIRETGGAAFRVSDAQITAAQAALARRGLIAEPTSSATAAALPQIIERYGRDKRIICCLTGNGLKNVGR